MKNFITFEGCEGVGKSTQLRLLNEYCVANNIDAVFTREPGGSRIAELVRNIVLDTANKDMDVLCEAFLFASARVQHLKEIVVPALASGKIVFCDRFVDSSYAYQGFGRGLGLEFVKKLNALAVGEHMPQLTVFLDLPPKQAFLRKGGEDSCDRMEQNSIEFFELLYDGYKQIALQEPHRIVSVDASGTKQETHKSILQLLHDKGIF